MDGPPRKGASIAISGKGWKAIKAIDAEAATGMVASGVPVTSVSLAMRPRGSGEVGRSSSRAPQKKPKPTSPQPPRLQQIKKPEQPFAAALLLLLAPFDF